MLRDSSMMIATHRVGRESRALLCGAGGLALLILAQMQLG
jgi:hypothetical protein